MQPELSAFQIVNACANIKKQYRTLSANGDKRIKYVIYYQNPSTSQDWQQYAAGDTKNCDTPEHAFAQFDEAFDYATQHLRGAIRVRVVFMDSHSKPLSDQNIPIMTITDTITAPKNMPDGAQTPVEGAVVPSYQQQQQQQPQGFTQAGIPGLGSVLGLMGFSGLNGADDSPMGALGAILQVRDGLKDAQYERQDLMRKLEEAITEKALLKEKVKGLEKDVKEKDDKITRLEDTNEDLEDEIETLKEELQRRETISGIGSIAIQKLAGNIIRRNPEKVSRLLGMSAEDMLGMIDGAEEPAPAAPATIPTVEVEVEDDSPRKEQIREISEFCKGLSDEDWQAFMTIVDVFRQDSRTIGVVLGMMQHSAAGAVHGEGQAVELED